jgi:hypothetical protein
VEVPQPGKKPKKFPEIPTLQDYEVLQEGAFWDKFPSRPLPDRVSSSADPDKLEKRLMDLQDKLLASELSRGLKAVDFLRKGASVHTIKHLGPCQVPNSKVAVKYGEEVTDSIASWVKKGFVAGPFISPPLKNFRCNSILAVPQPGKVRNCINVSLPTGNSLNENIDKSKLEKVTMTSAKLFSYSILEAGVGCKMGKFDLEDAYKNVPVPIGELNLQGFSWLSKYFMELKQMFGTVSSVQNFDIIGNTLKAISMAECNIPRRWVHRQLDDVPYVSRANSPDGTLFEAQYREICDTIGIALAKECLSFDKAFSNSTYGKVLGIIFDTTTLSWRLSDEKNLKYKNLIATLFNKRRVSLFDLQNLMGCLNHITQMCPFFLCFRFNILKCLKLLENDPTRWSLSKPKPCQNC